MQIPSPTMLFRSRAEAVLAAVALAAPVPALAQESAQGPAPTGAGEPGVGEPGVGSLSRSELEALVRDLEGRIVVLEGDAKSADHDPAVDRMEATHSTREGYWNIPGTDMTIKLGGYVKLDAIHDFDEIGNEYKFATQTIAVPGGSEPRTTFHARETRINLDVRRPFGQHEGRVFIEGDFFGDGNTFELRHAYGEVGGLLAGQTWTTYMDLSSRPHTLDFEGPDAELFVRQPMVRWTQGIGDGVSFSVALEDSSQDLTTTGGFTGDAITPYPDLTGNVRLENEHRHLQFSGVLRYLNFEGDPGSPDESTMGWGLALSGKTELGAPSRRLMGQVSAGEGSARYNQSLRGAGSDAVLMASSLDALPLYTGVLAYEHDWSEKWTSAFAYSLASVDNDSAQAANALHETQSASANLVWHPYPRFLTGVEYLYGIREDNDGQDGDAHRVQFSFKFLF